MKIYLLNEKNKLKYTAHKTNILVYLTKNIITKRWFHSNDFNLKIIIEM